jgi:YbbR domain-containing protein
MEFLQRNWILKLVSLLLACALYVWVQRQESSSTREFSLPVEIPVPTGQVLVEPPIPPTVHVTVEGPAGQLESIQERDIHPAIRVSTQPTGQTLMLPVVVDRRGTLAEEGLSLRVDPARIGVQTQARIERPVQVTVDAEGALPEGWDWVQLPRPDTEQVMVSGLKPAVDQVARVIAAVRTLNPQEQVVASVSLRAVDRTGTEVERVTLDPPVVLVRAHLTRTVWSKRVYVQPIFNAPPGARLRVTLDPKRVMVYGTSRALQELHFIETPELDIPAGQPRFAQEVRLELTAGITRIEPPTVRVTIEQLQPGEH